MTPQVLYPILCLFLVLFPSQTVGADPKQVRPSYQETISMISLAQDPNPRLYKVLLNDLPDESHLSITVLSSNNTAPYAMVTYIDSQDANGPPKEQSLADGGIIWIPHSALRTQSDVELKLMCNRERCSADLLIEFSREINAVADGVGHRYEKEIGDATSSAVIRLYVPDNPNADRIIIHAEAIPGNDYTVPSLELFINKGNEIPDTNASEIIPRSAWFEGRTVVIYKATELFATDAQYTLSLKFAAGSRLFFMASVQESSTKLFGSYLTDAVQPGHSNMYTYVNLFKDKDILFDISPQKGALEVDIVCDSNAEDHWNFKVDKTREEIVLTPEEHSTCTSESYNVKVTSNESAVYNIRAITRITTDVYLLKNEPVMGSIDPQESIQYELALPYYSTEKIELKLETQGKVNMSVINCKFSNDCPGFTVDTTHHPDVGGEIKEFNYESKTLETGGQSIIIDFHNGGCYPVLIDVFWMHSDPMPICAYKINITSQDATKVDYTISVYSEGHELLLLGSPRNGVVAANETLFYVLNVPQENTASVSFQLTVFSGHAEIFASRTQEFPTENLGEAQLQHEGLVVFKNTTNLQGRYYVGVRGTEISSFSLTSTAIDVNGAAEENALFLPEGTPQKGVLLPKHEYPGLYYRMDMSLADDFQGVIKISSVCLQGKILLTASTEISTPNPIMTTWTSQTGTLEINSTDKNFVRKGTYYLGVTVDWSDPRSYSVEDVTFIVSYHILHKDSEELSNMRHIVLTSFYPHKGVIKPNETVYFKVYILPSEQNITVLKQADSGDIDIYLSTSTHNTYPGPDNYNMSTKDTHQDHLSLNTTDFENACKDKANNKLCEFNFAVMTSSTEQVSYTLSIQRAERGASAVALEDGRQSVFALPQSDRPSLFYFYPAPGKDAFIEVWCPYKEIEIYANRRKVIVDASNAGPQLKDVPTIEVHDFNSPKGTDLENGFARLMIPGDTESNSTVITVSVYFKEGYSASKASNSVKSKTFNIVASSHIVEIYMGKQLSSFVARDTYQYFFFNVHRKECDLLISLTTLDDGDADLVVSQGWLSRPTLEDHTFASISPQGTELLKILPLDIYPKDSMEGIWVVGVYGRSDSRFALTVFYQEKTVIELQQGIPMEMYMAADSKLYFKYLHQTEEDFDINIDQMSGDITAYVGTLPIGEQVEENLPSKDSSTWTIRPDRESVLKIKGDLCAKCMYLITLEINQSSKFLITAIEEKSIVRIQNAILYQGTLLANESKKYMFFSKNYEEIDMSISLKSGSFGVYTLNNPAVNSSNAIFQKQLTADDPDYQLQVRKEHFNNAPMVIWDGDKQVASLKNVFFFNFENIGNSPAKYSFTVSLKEGTPILTLGAPQEFPFGPIQKRSFFYYSPHVNGMTTLVLSYCTVTVKSESETKRDIIFSQLLEGFDIKIVFWNQRVTAGVGEEITETKNEIFIDTMQERGGLLDVCLQQTIVIANQNEEGRYEFTLKNPIPGNTLLSLRVDTTEINYKIFDRNTQYLETLSIDEVKDFEVIMPSKGVWYFNIFSCQGKLKVIVGDTPEAIESQESTVRPISGLTLPKRFHYHVAIEESGVKYVRVKGVNMEGENATAIEFIVISNFFQDDQVLDYTPTTQRLNFVFENPGVQHDYQYDGIDSKLMVNFNPVQFKETDTNDQLSFFIRLCPEDAMIEKENYCVPFYPLDECISQFQSVNANTTAGLTQAFENVVPGRYNLQIVGSVAHEGDNTVPFAYRAYDIELKEPVVNQIMDYLYVMLIGLVVVVVVGVGVFLVYRAVRRAAAARKGSSIGRNYDFVPEETD